jgi:hypothetical protein
VQAWSSRSSDRGSVISFLREFTVGEAPTVVIGKCNWLVSWSGPTLVCVFTSYNIFVSLVPPHSSVHWGGSNCK